MRFVIRFITNAIAITIITSGILPGIFIVGEAPLTILVLALVFGLVNALIKPLVRVLTCPFVLLTFGLLTFVINGAMLYLAARIGELAVNITRGQVVIENFAWAIVGALVISIIDVLLEWLLVRLAPVPVRAARSLLDISAPTNRSPYDPPPTPTSSTGDEFDFYDPKTGKIKPK